MAGTKARLDLPSAHQVEESANEARHGGASMQSVNETVTPEQASGKRLSEVVDGPNIGEAGEFRPATYRTRNGFLREDR